MSESEDEDTRANNTNPSESAASGVPPDWVWEWTLSVIYV